MKTWHSIDKSTWQKGPWTDEPDKAHWIDAQTDYDCLIVRTPHSGSLCGYVGVSPSHRYYQKDYNKLPSIINRTAHGGLTFADFCQDNHEPGRGICHTPADGRESKIWWLGFDCAHSGDYCPVWIVGKNVPRQQTVNLLNTDFMGNPSIYRDFEYVKSIVTDLAKILKMKEKKPSRLNQLEQ